MNTPKYQTFNGLKFCRDDKTGYYLNSTNKVRMHRYVWQFYHGDIPDGCDVHHINHDKADNRIENLMLMDEGAHSSMHLKEYHAGHKKETMEHLNSIRNMTKEWHASKEGREWHKKHYDKTEDKLHVSKEFVCTNCGKRFIGQNSGCAYCSAACAAAWRRKSGIDDEERRCCICGKPFIANKYKKTKTCSKSCSQVMRWRNQHKET